MINKCCDARFRQIWVVLGFSLLLNPIKADVGGTVVQGGATSLEAVEISIKISGDTPTPSSTKMSLPINTLLDNEWGMQKQPGLNLRAAWDNLTKKKMAKTDLDCTNSPIVVALIDTGVDFTHSSLQESKWVNEKERAATEKIEKANQAADAKCKASKLFCKLTAKPVVADNDKNDFKGDINGWDFATDSPVIIDGHGHGTHLAGIISGKSPEANGFHGVCPGVKIMSLRYFASDMAGIKNLDNTVKAIRYAIRNGAKIINYSGGGASYSAEEFAALKEATKKGILVVAAAGNERSDTKKHPYYPASYDLQNLISVAGIAENGKLIPASNWGSTTVDVAAPGGSILSLQQNESYGFMNGTSQATAFVSGLAALLWTSNPKLTAGEVKEIISRSATKIPSLKNKVKSEGYADAEMAVKMLANFKNSKPQIKPEFKKTIEAAPRILSGLETPPVATLKK